jgi:ankyrin repeat protein
MAASAFGHPQIVELLLKYGAKVNARTSKSGGNRTALSIARKNLKHMKISRPKDSQWERVEKMLLSAGAKP